MGWGEETARWEKESQVHAKPSWGFPQQLQFQPLSQTITGLPLHRRVFKPAVTPTAPAHEWTRDKSRIGHKKKREEVFLRGGGNRWHIVPGTGWEREIEHIGFSGHPRKTLGFVGPNS
jgi:hypothetical protein